MSQLHGLEIYILYYSVVYDLLVSALYLRFIYMVMFGQHWHDFAGYPRSRDEDAQGSE